MIKRAFLAIGALFLMLVIVVVGRTIWVGAARDTETAATLISTADIDVDLAARRLSEAIGFRTISHGGGQPHDVEAYRGFHAWLERTYPAFTRATTLEKVNDLTLIYTWPGSDPGLEPIMLLSHIDVVPVVPGTEEDWIHPPYSGAIADGYVWGRGTLDCKGSLVAMVEAAEALISQGFAPERTVMFGFGHDEEIGGPEGNLAAVKLFEERGIRFAMVSDEGGGVADGLLPGVDRAVALLGVSEKGSVTIELTARADGGHSSMPPPETAIGRLARAVERLQANPFPGEIDEVTEGMLTSVAPYAPFGMRVGLANLWLTGGAVEGVMSGAPTSDAQLRTTTAPTIIKGGVKSNVMPSSATATVNFRIHPRDTIQGVIDRVTRVVNDANIEITAVGVAREASPVSPIEGEMWEHLHTSVASSFPNTSIAPYLTIAGTDSRHYSAVSDHIYRFNGIRLGPEEVKGIHGTNERMSIESLGAAILFYRTLIEASAGPA